MCKEGIQCMSKILIPTCINPMQHFCWQWICDSGVREDENQQRKPYVFFRSSFFFPHWYDSLYFALLLVQVLSYSVNGAVFSSSCEGGSCCSKMRHTAISFCDTPFILVPFTPVLQCCYYCFHCYCCYQFQQFIFWAMHNILAKGIVFNMCRRIYFEQLSFLA